MAKSNLIDLDARLVHETDKAFLFDFGLKQNIWIPRSACEFNLADGVVTLSEPLAIEKGLV